MSSNLTQGSSSRDRKTSKSRHSANQLVVANTGNRKNLLNHNELVSAFNASHLEIPSVSTNGMKNIEHFIDRTLIDGKQWYRCKWQNCSYSTTRSDSIVRHMRKHTGERPYKCWFCSYATIQSSGLKIHIRRHTGEKPYVCKYANCGKRFTVLNSLVVHERTHTGCKPYKCSFANSCNYSSSDRCNLVYHMRTSHQIDLNAKPNASTTCSTSNATQMAIFNDIGGGSGQPLTLVGNVTSPPMMMSNYQTLSVQNHNQMIVNNCLSNNTATSTAGQLKHSATTSPFVPLNLLSVISGGTNYENIQNNQLQTTTHGVQRKRKTTTASTGTSSSAGHRRAPKNRVQPVLFNNDLAITILGDDAPTIVETATTEPSDINSVKRVMIMVDKRMVNNRSSYFCKWPSCGYETFRSDSIVRHIRSHTGERPYKCNYENCNYATIQRSTLNKHLSKHQNVFN